MRTDHIRASTEKTLKWMKPYLQGITDLAPFVVEDTLDADYLKKLEPLANSTSDIEKAFAFSERVRLTVGKGGMMLDPKVLAATVDTAPVLSDRRAKEMVSKHVIGAFPVASKAAKTVIGKLWAADQNIANGWLEVGRLAAARSSDQPMDIRKPVLEKVRKQWWASAALDTYGNDGAVFKPGQALPNLQFDLWTGEYLSLSQLKKNKALIIYTAFWCGACRQEIKEVGRLVNVAKAKGIPSILVSGDFDIAQTLAWMKAEGVDIPVAYTGGPFGYLPMLSGTGGWPMFLPVEKGGKLATIDLDPKERLKSLSKWIEG